MINKNLRWLYLAQLDNFDGKEIIFVKIVTYPADHCGKLIRFCDNAVTIGHITPDSQNVVFDYDFESELSFRGLSPKVIAAIRDNVERLRGVPCCFETAKQILENRSCPVYVTLEYPLWNQ